jgi:hypothetical protein
VVKNLGENLFIYRQHAYHSWQQIRQRLQQSGGAAAPREVLGAAENLLLDPDISTDEKAQLLDFLLGEPETATTDFAVKLIENIALPFEPWFTNPSLRQVATALVARSGRAVDRTLDILNDEHVPETQAQYFAFGVLSRHIGHLRGPLGGRTIPDKAWMGRALAACRKYPSDVTQALIYEIKGPPPRPSS